MLTAHSRSHSQHKMATDPSLTTFGDLEHELLVEKILSFVTDTRHRQTLRQVSKSWNELINCTFGIKLVVNNLNRDLLTQCACVTELELNSVILPVDVNELPFCNRLRSLKFYKIVASFNLFPLLSSMPNLVDVHFQDTIMELPEGLIQAPQQNDGSKSNIQKLYFQCSDNAESLSDLFSVLCKLELGSLKEIHFVTTKTPCNSFQKIFIPTEHAVPTGLHPFVRLIVKNLATIQQVSYGPRFKFYPNAAYEAGQVKQLEELVVAHLFHPEYAAILSTQNRLRILETGCCKYELLPNFRNCILENAATLEKIYVGNNTAGLDWNCNVFTNLRSLNDLALVMYFSRKIDIHLLPASLRKLSLGGTISKEELEQICHLSNLEHLQILDHGQHRRNIDIEERIGLNLVKRLIIQLPNLKMLTFKDCSTESLDWDGITNWITTEAPNYGIQGELLHYQGWQTIHGFNLTLPENGRRNITIDEDRSGESILEMAARAFR